MGAFGFRFRDISIRSKVMLVTCAASLVALFAVAGGLYLFELRHFRQTFQTELQTLARIMADNCATALAFNDAKTANEVLGPLGVKPEIISAAVFGKTGRNFAFFSATNDTSVAGLPPIAQGVADHGSTWSVVQPIVFDGERIGTLLLEADYASPRAALQRLFLGVTTAVLGGSIVLVALLAMRLQNFIARPIQRLAAASEAVARDHDYSVRVQSPGKDELGRLTGAFNHMLARIQMQDAALLAARGELQSKVAALESEIIERQRAEAAQARLTAILEATPDFVGSMDPTGRTIYLNQGARRMIGMNGHSDRTPREICDYHPGWAGELVLSEGLPGAARDGTWSGDTALRHADGREIHVSQVVIAHRNAAGEVDYFSTVMRDVSERKAAAARLADLNKQLVEASRQAGMAEVATGVLHNVGNVLNSVNIAASTVIEKLRSSKVDGLAKASALLTSREADLADFLTADPQGKRLPGYLRKLAGFLVEENAAMRSELQHLGSNVEHIKEIVAMQQTYARATGFLEDVPVDKLIEDAVQLNLVSFKRHGIEVVRDVPPVPPVRVDKHKVLQILINLLRNAKHAVEDARPPGPRIGIALAHEREFVRIVVSDNGIGIAPENLTSVFRHGFTTKKNGHGFGLHSGANAARELGGQLTAASAGPGRGATFTLSLPVAPAALLNL